MMSPNLIIIDNLKKESFSEAKDSSIEIRDDNKIVIGKLIPVGKWTLKNDFIIDQIYSWRKRAMRYFLTRFKPSFELTFNYIKNISIEDKNRIFFLIYDEEENLIGHIGLADIKDTNAELDNMMRGNHGGHKDLIYYAELAILSWSFNVLNIENINLRVFSFNRGTIQIHSRSGFTDRSKIYLYKKVENDITTHQEVRKENSNIEYHLKEMILNKKNFNKYN